jgi:glycosyltransferase involved in cell wall biosynthesis
VPYKDYPALAGSVQIGLCPVDPHDGFNWSKSGLKAIELMASKAAVVATDLHIYREVMHNGVHGFLVQHDADSWYAAIERLILDPDLRSRMAEAGRNHVGRNFSIERNAQLWWNAYRQIAHA